MYSDQFDSLYPIEKLKRRRGIEITAVDQGSLGYEIGLEKGDRILTINGRKLRDYIDFQFFTGSEEELKLEVEKTSGERWDLDVDIEEGEIWGLDFETFMPRQCANECLFCFCEMNPPEARASLFFRDEDIRLSFLHGNYTTMTNMSRDEINRIVEQRLSPQYVSVHATDLEVRRHLLGRDRIDDVLDKMRYFTEHGIELHAQIVLCPKINDGKHLEKTIFDLVTLYPGVQSAAIVPLGLNKHHKRRHLLTPVTSEWSTEIIDQVTPWQQKFQREHGTRFAFLGDEFYLRANRALPGKAHYEQSPQIEDGVGMVRRFVDDFKKMLKRRKKPFSRSIRGTVATGTLFYPILKQTIVEFNNSFGTELKPIAVVNDFFGDETTVAGLLSGRDFLLAKNEMFGDFLVLPPECVSGDKERFLDDMTLPQLAEKLAIPIYKEGWKSIFALME
ncbi:MAG: NifB/MoaA family Fe-S oxidoreductase [bacterium]|nr:MAG: NifB/MoaA family Fe-S oxidoreductase [bacterium]